MSIRTAAMGNVVPIVPEISPSLFSRTGSTHGMTINSLAGCSPNISNLLNQPKSFRRISFLYDMTADFSKVSDAKMYTSEA